MFSVYSEEKNDNKARNIGFSYHDNAELLDNILTAHPEIDVVQLQINYLDWDSPNVQSKKCYEVALKHKKRVIAMEPVKGGMLADIPYDAEVTLKRINSEASNASWAIRFVAGLDNVMVVLSGMSNIYQVNDNVDCMLACKPLSQHEVEAIQSVVETINNKIDIPCTACLYCSDVCKKIYQYPIIFHFIILIIANMVVLKLRNFLPSVIIMLIILVMEKQEIVYHAENVK